jgi:formyl-CoA transferase
MASFGVVVALLERERSGRGQWVHTSLLQAMIRLMEFQAGRWLIKGEVPGQAGNYHPISQPTGVYRAREGSLIIQAAGQPLFRRLCQALEAPELLDDPRFSTLHDRLVHRDELSEEIERRLASRDAKEWAVVLNRAGVPAGPILNVQECFENEQVKTLPVTATVEHPLLGKLTLLAPGVNLERTPGRIRSATPEPGQHTDEILAESGYDADQIATFRREGAV